MRRRAFVPAILLMALSGACEGAPPIGDHPTWADVEPILRGQCNHCHGSTAQTTGSTAGGAVVYRFDFFDSGDGDCGEAAAAVDRPASIKVAASLIRESVASINGNRPRMPPAPSPLLTQWERETIHRWIMSPPLAKGPAPWTNRMPRLQIFEFPKRANRTVMFTALVSDPDGDPVLGVIKPPVASEPAVKLDRTGSFVVSMDSSAWPVGRHTVIAVLCDGWANTSFEVGQVEISR